LCSKKGGKEKKGEKGKGEANDEKTKKHQPKGPRKGRGDVPQRDKKKKGTLSDRCCGVVVGRGGGGGGGVGGEGGGGWGLGGGVLPPSS